MNLLSLGTVPTVNLLLYMLVMLLSFIAAYLIIYLVKICMEK